MIDLGEARKHHHIHPTAHHQRNDGTERMKEGQMGDARVITGGMNNKNGAMMDKGTMMADEIKEGQTTERI